MEDFRKDFSTQKLCEWINLQLHFGEDYNEIFVNHHINGDSFLELDLNKLAEMGVKVVGHRLSIYGLVRSERKKLNLPIQQRKKK